MLNKNGAQTPSGFSRIIFLDRFWRKGESSQQSDEVTPEFIFNRFEKELQSHLANNAALKINEPFVLNFLDSIATKLNPAERSTIIDSICKNYISLLKAKGLDSEKLKVYDYIIVYLFTTKANTVQSSNSLQKTILFNNNTRSTNNLLNDAVEHSFLPRLSSGLVSLPDGFDFDMCSLFRSFNTPYIASLVHRNNALYLVNSEKSSQTFLEDMKKVPTEFTLKKFTLNIIHRNLQEVCEDAKQNLGDNFLFAYMGSFSSDALFEKYHERLQSYLTKNDLKSYVSFIREFFANAKKQLKDADIPVFMSLNSTLGVLDPTDISAFINKICENYLKLANDRKNQKELRVFDNLVLYLHTSQIYANLESLKTAIEGLFLARFNSDECEFRDFLVHKNNILYFFKSRERKGNFEEKLDKISPKYIISSEVYVRIYKNLYETYHDSDPNLADNFVLHHMAYFSDKSLRDIYFDEKSPPSHFLRKELCYFIKYKLVTLLNGTDDPNYKNPRLKKMKELEATEGGKALKPEEKEALKVIKKLKEKACGHYKSFGVDNPAEKDLIDSIIFQEDSELETFHSGELGQPGYFSPSQILDGLFGTQNGNPSKLYLYTNTFGARVVLEVFTDLKNLNDSEFKLKANTFGVYGIASSNDKTEISYISLKNSIYLPEYLKSRIKSTATVAEVMAEHVLKFLVDPGLMSALGLPQKKIQDLLGSGFVEAIFNSLMTPNEKSMIPQNAKEKILSVFNDDEVVLLHEAWRSSIFSHSEARYILNRRKTVHVHLVDDISKFNFESLAGNKNGHEYVLSLNNEKQSRELYLVSLSGLPVKVPYFRENAEVYFKELESRISSLMKSTNCPYLVFSGNELTKFYEQFYEITPETLVKGNPDICRLLYDEVVRNCILNPETAFSSIRGVEPARKKALVQLIQSIGKAFKSNLEPGIINLFGNAYKLESIYWILGMCTLSLSSDNAFGSHVQMFNHEANGTPKVHIMNDSLNVYRLISTLFFTLFIETISPPFDRLNESTPSELRALQKFLSTCKMFLIQINVNECASAIGKNFEFFLNDKKNNNSFLFLRSEKIFHDGNAVMAAYEHWRKEFRNNNTILKSEESLCNETPETRTRILAERDEADKKMDEEGLKLSRLSNSLEYFRKLLNENKIYDPINLVRAPLNLGEQEETFWTISEQMDAKKLLEEKQKRWAAAARNAQQTVQPIQATPLFEF